jgi:hypothetical protein
MRTISARRGPARALAALVLIGTGTPAAASGSYEQPRQYKSFASRSACEQALKRRYRSAVERLAAIPEADRQTSRVGPPERDDDGRLGFFETRDHTVRTEEMVMPNGITVEYSCHGRRLELRTYLEGGGYQFLPPPPPPSPPEETPQS